LGFDRNKALNALEKNSGNIKEAADLLLYSVEYLEPDDGSPVSSVSSVLGEVGSLLDSFRSVLGEEYVDPDFIGKAGKIEDLLTTSDIAKINAVGITTPQEKAKLLLDDPRYKPWLNDYDLVHIPGDGNCLYRSIACGIDYNKKIVEGMTSIDAIKTSLISNEDVQLDMSIAYRFAAAKYINDNWESFGDFITEAKDDYYRDMTTTARWGGEGEIIALSEYCNQQIVVHSVNHYGKDAATYNPQQPPHQPIYIIHTGAHYNLLLQKQGEKGRVIVNNDGLPFIMPS
jgi:hypothetical protein